MKKILAISGSLRKKSYNTSILRYIKQKFQDQLAIEIYTLEKLPLFNEDFEKPELPAAVIEFKNKFANADALLIAAPEYNHSFTGVLKNAIDWASRKYDQPNSILFAKQIAIFGASPGGWGTKYSQEALLKVLEFLQMLIFHEEKLEIADVYMKIDDQGTIQDEKLKEQIDFFCEKFMKTVSGIR
ncbi:MAG: NADPH-dependent FMN reductase [bacterium]